MGRRPSVDLQDVSVEFVEHKELQQSNSEIGNIVSLYLRAFEEIGFRHKPGRKPTRVRNAPKRQSKRRIKYGI